MVGIRSKEVEMKGGFSEGWMRKGESLHCGQEVRVSEYVD